jgi:hypothetical protein
MKSKKSRWLDTALRAQQARTLDQRYRVHETEATHRQAQEHESAAVQELHALALSWRQGRGDVQHSQSLDGLYQRFHAHLHAEAAEATQARASHQLAFEAALSHLRQSHALQQGLDRTIQRRDQRSTKDALAKERSSATETWMLAQACKKGSE